MGREVDVVAPLPLEEVMVEAGEAGLGMHDRRMHPSFRSYRNGFPLALRQAFWEAETGRVETL